MRLVSRLQQRFADADAGGQEAVHHIAFFRLLLLVLHLLIQLEGETDVIALAVGFVADLPQIIAEIHDCRRCQLLLVRFDFFLNQGFRLYVPGNHGRVDHLLWLGFRRLPLINPVLHVELTAGVL